MSAIRDLGLGTHRDGGTRADGGARADGGLVGDGGGPADGGLGGGGADAGSVAPDGDCFTLQAGSLDGFDIQPVAALVNDPRAGTPAYAYLERNLDAVQIEAPSVEASDDLEIADLRLDASSLRSLQQPSATQEIYEVLVPGGSSTLRYAVSSNDFEQEVELRRVLLCATDEQLTASFIFAGTGTGGVAHDVAIHVEHAGQDLGSSAPLGIEVR